jgi:hypothetical protein
MNEHREGTLVTTELSARVLLPCDESVAARVELRYISTDPFAVQMTISVRGIDPCTWMFGRELLDDGLRRTSGVGAVTIEPCPQAATTLLHVTLRDAVISAVLELHSAVVDEFLSRTYETVPRGREGLFLPSMTTCVPSPTESQKVVTWRRRRGTPNSWVTSLKWPGVLGC